MERQAITVEGIVQGVGFRPFVFRLASRLQLGGFVKNLAGSVLIEVEGTAAHLGQFLHEIQSHPPTLARIDDIHVAPRALSQTSVFQIIESDVDPNGAVFVSPDMAVCGDCLTELFDPADRRFRYPFLNCTNCGPRLTIIQETPYDRSRTTMSGFQMCPACEAEYHDPRNRRFHAQPTACPECGPQLILLDHHGKSIPTQTPLTTFAARVLAGQIGAVLGVGGFHLVCSARNPHAVNELRKRKQRDEKPFAIMVENVAEARLLCDVDPTEQALLESARRPIVLLRKRVDAPCRIAEAVAPENPVLGIMLPDSPLHYLLADTAKHVPLVMTSGNRSDEPIACENEDALERLSGIADLFLTHHRPVHVRCDDSVTQVVAGRELPLRRSRGVAPQPVKLPFACPVPILALGGQLKGAFAIGRDHQVFLSHHLGDLDHYEAYRAFERDILLYEQLFDIAPVIIAHDLHPDYATTNYARQRAAESDVELVGIQHHHAHLASCMTEQNLQGPAIGIAFDGSGYGTDGAVWGGEFFVGAAPSFHRVCHFRYVGLPGSEKAIREPWRMGLAHLLDAGCDPGILAGPSRSELRTIEQMLDRKLNCPPTSSVGRLFDAVAAIAGVRSHVTYEGQAAMQLEWLASRVDPDGTYPFEITADSTRSALPGLIIDTRPLIRAIADDVRRGTDIARIARRFHSSLAEIVVEICLRIQRHSAWMSGRDELETVVISGGVFHNAILTCELDARLTAAQFRIARHQHVPPGDGGLSLGQLAIAAKVARSAALTGQLPT